MWSVYSSADTLTVDVSELRGRCCVSLADNLRLGAFEETGFAYDVYRCIGTLGKDGKVTSAPKSLDVKGGASQPKPRNAASASNRPFEYDGVALKTLDIFAGDFN